MRKDVIVQLGLAALLVSAGVAPRTLSNHIVVRDAAYRPSEIEAAKDSIALSLMGQLQLSVGDLMWLKSMEYLHQGTVQRMPTRGEEDQGYTRKEATKTAVGLGHMDGVNMVLDKNRDWRGLFGEIHRNVACYQEHHGHDDPTEIIPWYQLAVKLNPKLERLYTLGAFYLADFAKAPADAKELLLAGLDANPHSFEIHAALGRLYFEFARRLDELNAHADGETSKAVGRFSPNSPEASCQLAVEMLRKSVDAALELKLALRDQREAFDEFQQQINSEAYLFLAKSLTDLKEYDAAVAACDEGLEFARHNLLRVQKRIIEDLRADSSQTSK